MNKLVKIENVYKSLLNKYKKQHSFNKTTETKFNELNDLFIMTFKKDIKGDIITIEKRNEFDLLQGISSMISGEYHKSKALEFENKYKKLFIHRDKVTEVVKKYNENKPEEKVQFKKKDTRDPLKIKNPEYGYHVKNPRFPLLEDNEYFY